MCVYAHVHAIVDRSKWAGREAVDKGVTGRIVASETVFHYERECACERVNFPGQGSLAVDWPVAASPHPHTPVTHTRPRTHQIERPEPHDDP